MIVFLLQVVISVLMLLFASYTDFKTRRVHQASWMLPIAVAIPLMAFVPIHDLIGGLSITIVVVAFAILLWNRNYIGGGDVKIFLALGLLNPYPDLILLTAVGSFFNLVMWKILGDNDKKTPFVPLIAVAYCISLAVVTVL